MAEITLEQRVALVAAWLQRAERLARGQTALSPGDLPPGYTLTADAFILRQCTLARQAAEALEPVIQDARRAHADVAAMAAYKRSKLPEQVAKGTLDAKSANVVSAELAERIDRAREAAGHCEALLRLLAGEEEAAAPKLPLFQYALTWREFQEAPGAVAEPKEEPTTTVPPVETKGRSFVLYYRRLQRSDKIAIIAAILGSLSYDRIAGVPYAGLPIGTAIALATGVPLIYPRKEAKQHGTGKIIEGQWQAGERVVIIEDLITSAGSIIQSAERLREAGLVVEDAIVLIDREQGGMANLAAAGIRGHAVYRLSEAVSKLTAGGQIDSATAEQVMAFVRGKQ